MTAFRKGHDPRRYTGGAKRTKGIDAWAFAALWYQPEIPVPVLAKQFGISDRTASKLARRYGLTPRMALLEKAKLGPWKRKAA